MSQVRKLLLFLIVIILMIAASSYYGNRMRGVSLILIGSITIIENIISITVNYYTYIQMLKTGQIHATNQGLLGFSRSDTVLISFFLVMVIALGAWDQTPSPIQENDAPRGSGDVLPSPNVAPLVVEQPATPLPTKTVLALPQNTEEQPNHTKSPIQDVLDIPQTNVCGIGIVLEDHVNVRREASITAEVQGQLDHGVMVEILFNERLIQGKHVWINIRAADHEGYISQKFLQIVGVPNANSCSTAVVLDDYVNIRQDANIAAKVVDQVHRGTSVQVLFGERTTQANYTWIKVRRGEIEGYISESFLYWNARLAP